MNREVCLVIPAYNEGERLILLLSNIKKIFPLRQVIVVDDGSKVRLTGPLFNEVNLVRHRLNLGKGAALKTGIELAIKMGYKYFLLMDADLQHDPREIPNFIKLSRHYDLILGARNLGPKDPFIRQFGNRLASLFVNIFYRLSLSDILSGYRLLNIKAYQKLFWTSTGYAVETEMIVRLSIHKSELKFTQIPIKTIYVDKYKGVNMLTAMRVLVDSLWWRLSIK